MMTRWNADEDQTTQLPAPVRYNLASVPLELKPYARHGPGWVTSQPVDYCSCTRLVRLARLTRPCMAVPYVQAAYVCGHGHPHLRTRTLTRTRVCTRVRA